MSSAVLVMDVLPDCDACDSPVVLDVDDDGQAVEVCTGCDLKQRPMPVFDGVLTAVRAIRLLGADVQPVLCRACTAGRHATCWRVRCACNHPGATP